MNQESGIRSARIESRVRKCVVAIGTNCGKPPSTVMDHEKL